MRNAVSQATFADLEFLRQGIQLDPVLGQISDFLDRHSDLVALVERDLDRGLKRAETGRPGLAAEQTLRAFILWRIKD
jgi:IS5 family transposase